MAQIPQTSLPQQNDQPSRRGGRMTSEEYEIEEETKITAVTTHAKCLALDPWPSFRMRGNYQ